jgi:xanthine dehydrogenase accessory factor
LQFELCVPRVRNRRGRIRFATSAEREVTMAEWVRAALQDDMRSRMFELSRRGLPFALATIADADGGPRPVGSQLVLTRQDRWGFLSGGCIEADIALHGRTILERGEPRILVYGRGSPFIDIRLPCGGRLEVMVERVAPGDPAVNALLDFTKARRSAWWSSNGRQRWCRAEPCDPAQADLPVVRRFDPPQRLVVIGSDPFALAIAGQGAQIGWEATLLAPFGPADLPSPGVRYDRRPLHLSLPALEPDRWTAIAVATHDPDADEAALVQALISDAGYVGALGSRRKIDDRVERLRRAGLTDASIKRLHTPIGLSIGASGPSEVAVAVAAEIIEQNRRVAPAGRVTKIEQVDASAAR